MIGTDPPPGGLWIVPAPWKTHKTSFPPGLGRTERVHTLHRRPRWEPEKDRKMTSLTI